MDLKANESTHMPSLSPELSLQSRGLGWAGWTEQEVSGSTGLLSVPGVSLFWLVT